MGNPYTFKNSNIRGLQDSYRKQWEEENKEYLEKETNYFAKDDDYKKRVFRNQAIKSLTQNRDSILKLSKFKDEELNQLLASNKSLNEDYTVSYLPATASMRESSTDLFTDDIDKIALNAKGVDFNRAANSVSTSGEKDDLLTLNVATGQEKINKQMLDNNPALRETAIANVKKVAEIISPEYLRYRNTDKLNEEPEQFWSDLAAKYQAFVDAGDDARANRELAKAIQDTVYKNQSTGEMIFNTAAGTIDSAIGVCSSAVGVTLNLVEDLFGGGLVRHAFANEEEKKKGSYWTRVLDDYVDNFWNRQSDTITKFGLMQYYDKYFGNEEEQQYAKDLEETGVGRYALAKGANNATVPALLELMQQYGFTAGSMMSGAGEAALATRLFQGARWTTKTMRAVRAAEKTLGQKKALITATNKVLDNLKKAEDFVHRWLVPVLVGTAEGAVEGLSTKEEVKKEGQQKIDANVQQLVTKEAFKILNNCNPTLVKDTEGRATTHYYDNNGREINPLDVYNALYEQYMQTKNYQDMQAEVEWAANTAGTDNFLINSAINGFINKTLTSSQFYESTANRIKNSRLLSKLEGARQVVTRGAAGTASATVEYTGLTPLNYLYRWAKEPFGEALEEVSQTESNVFTKGAAMHTVDTFIKNRLNGDGLMQVGESLTTENLSAAFTALKEQDMSEVWYSAGAGAFTSIVGGVHIGRRGYKGVKRDKKGNIVRDKNGNIQYERTWGRGIREDGTQESWFDVASRVTPWRSGLFTNVRATYMEDNLYKRRAAALTKFAQDPKNIEKLDGLAGTDQWQKLLNKAALNNDEFNFRSAQKGKFINDVIMLESLKGTQMHAAIYDNLTETANMKADSERAQTAVEFYKKNIDPNTTLKDNEIVDLLKKNANDIIETTNQIKTSYNEIEKIFGDIDPEAKKAIAFNRIIGEDFKIRQKQLQEEYNKLNMQVNSTQTGRRTVLDDTGKKFIARYGSIKNIKERLGNKNKYIENLNKDIDFYEKLVNRTEKQENTLKELKAKKEAIDKNFKEVEDWYNDKVLGEKDENGNQEDKMTDESIALNEQEIMALPAQERAAMLAKGLGKAYKVFHTSTEELSDNSTEEIKSPYSPEQQKYINSLVSQLGGIENVQKIIDLAAVEQGIVDNTKEYNKILNNKKDLEEYIHQVKFNAKIRAIKDKVNPVLEAGSYEEFVDKFNSFQEESNDFEKEIAHESLRNNENYKKYKKSGDYLNRVANHAINDKTSLDEARTYPALIKYLIDNGITADSTNEEILNKLFEADETGKARFESYIERLNDKLGLNIDVASLNTIASNFKNALNKYNTNRVVVDVATNSPQPTNATASAAKPEVIIDETKENNEPVVILTDKQKKFLEDARERVSSEFTIDSDVTLEYMDDLQALGKATMIKMGLSSELDEEGKKLVDAEVKALQDKINQKYPEAVIVNEYTDTPAIAYKVEIKATQTKDNSDDSTNQEQSKVTLSESDKIYNKLVIDAYKDAIISRTIAKCKSFGINIEEQVKEINAFMDSIKDKVFNSPDEFAQYLLDNLDSLTKGSEAWNRAREVAIEALNKNSGKFTEIRREAREKANKQAKAKPISTDNIEGSSRVTTNSIYLDNPAEDINLPDNHPLKAFMRQFTSTDEIINLTLLKRIPGQETNIFYYYDKQLDKDVAEFYKSNPEEYKQQGSPVIVLYQVQQPQNNDTYKTIEIGEGKDKKYYVPIGTLPNNNSDFGPLTESIRGKIGDRDNSHLIKDVSSGNRIYADKMTSKTDGSSDKNLKSVLYNSSKEFADKEKNEGRPLDTTDRKSIYKRLIKEFLAPHLKQETVADKKDSSRTYEMLVYEMLDGRPGGQTTQHWLFVNNFDEVRNNSNLSMQEYYEQNGTIKGFNPYFNKLEKELATKLSAAVRRNYLPVGDKDFQSFDKSEFATKLNIILKSYFKSSLAGDYELKRSPSGKQAIYFKDELLTELNISQEGASINFDELFNNLIFPNGQMRELMTFQVDYNSIIGDLRKKGESEKFDLALDSNLFRVNINSIFRPNTQITVTIPQGISASPAKPRTINTGSDIANSNLGSGHETAQTPSGDNVDPITGRMENGEIPKNPSTNPLQLALQVISKMITDCKQRHSDEKNHKSRGASNNGNGIFGRGVTSDLKHNIPDEIRIPSTNIGNIADVLLRDWLHQFNIRMTIARNNKTDARLTEENIDEFINENFEEWTDPESGKVYLRSAKGIPGERTVYYNFTPDSIRNYLKHSGMIIANYFLDRGLRLYTKEIGAEFDLPMDKGTIEHKFADFDMVAIDDNGNFHLFDYKSHTWEDPNKPASYDKSKTNLEAAMEGSWREQLSRYKYGMEIAYLQNTGLQVVECAIISNIVEYDDGRTTKYISDDEEQGRGKFNRTSKLLVENEDGELKDYRSGKIRLDTEKDEKGNTIPRLYHIQTKDYFNPGKGLNETYVDEETGAKPSIPDTHKPGEPIGDDTPAVLGDKNEATSDFELQNFSPEQTLQLLGEQGLSTVDELQDWWDNVATNDEQDCALNCMGKPRIKS